MEVRFSVDQQSQLAQFASRSGRDAEQVVRDAVEQLLNDARFAEAVKKGFASLDRGEYLEHEEVGARLERLFQS
jgi:predicted transcriptional regulator